MDGTQFLWLWWFTDKTDPHQTLIPAVYHKQILTLRQLYQEKFGLKVCKCYVCEVLCFENRFGLMENSRFIYYNLDLNDSPVKYNYILFISSIFTCYSLALIFIHLISIIIYLYVFLFLVWQVQFFTKYLCPIFSKNSFDKLATWL